MRAFWSGTVEHRPTSVAVLPVSKVRVRASNADEREQPAHSGPSGMAIDPAKMMMSRVD